MSAAIDESHSVGVDALVHTRYRITRKIGRGGMGAVFDAVDERLGTRVALKESFASELELKRQFGLEARLLASLRHKSLPRVTDYFVDGDRAYLVMEFIEGVSLAEVVSQQKSPLPVPDVIAWADQVLDVLIYLHGHDRKILHRDIKPHNLRLTPEGLVCLLDFGLAKVSFAEDELAEIDGRSVYGFTRRYSPIEQIQDSGTNERSDIYALGATLYHLLTGVKPEDSEERAAAIAAGGVDCLLRADLVLPAVGEELGVILERAMALESKDRFATAAEFREALKKLGRTSESGEPALGNERPSGVRNRSRTLAALAALLVMGLFSVGVYFFKVPNAGSDSARVANQRVAVAPGPAESPSLKSARAKPEKPKTTRKSSVPNGIAKRQDKPSQVVERNGEAKRSAAGAPVAVTKVTRVVERRELRPQRQSSEMLRAPDGTEVVRFKDGRIKVFGAGERGGGRQ